MISIDGNHPERGDTAFERATSIYGLCPNRVWTVAQTLLGEEQSLPLLLPAQDDEVARIFGLPKKSNDHNLDDRRACTYDDSCEISRQDFTKVSQRHEPSSCKGICSIMNPRKFLRSQLDFPSHLGGPTAWHLNGEVLVKPRMKFMAVSYVWSDGTRCRCLEGRSGKQLCI